MQNVGPSAELLEPAMARIASFGPKLMAHGSPLLPPRE
jgi:hypothetical protein